MKNPIYTVLFSIAMILSGSLSGEIIQTNEISTVLDHISQDSFVFFNINGTMYEPSNTLADNQWRQYFSKRVAEIVADTQESQAIIDRTKNLIVQRIPKKSVEEKTPQLIADLQAKKIVVLGLTQKQMSTTYAENFGWLTNQHLLSLGINLEKTLAYLKQKPGSEAAKGYSFAYGILFTNKQPEGPVLLSFLEEVDQKPSSIVAVDNSLSSLESLQQALEAKGIRFTGLRYGRSDALKENFDPALGTIEFFTFLNQGRIMSDAEALKIKESNPQTNYEAQLDEYIKQQQAK